MFSGSYTALVTPFRDGQLDEQRLREQVEYQITQGIDGLVPVGTTGESPTLSFEEHFRVIELAIRYVGGRVPVIAGVGANSTAEALKLHAFARQAGAAAGLSVNPYYNKPTQEGLYRHFMTLADGVDLPIVLYNIPGRTGVTMSPATVARLHRTGRFPAIKEATGSCDQLTEVRRLCDIAVLSGDDSHTLPFLSIGAVGVISVLSNIIPAHLSRLVSSARNNDWATARDLHYRYYDLTRLLFVEGNPGGVKCALELLGRDGGELRLPLTPVGESTRSAIKSQLQSLGLVPRTG